MTKPQSSERPIIFGEVLFDHFPDGSKVLGGAPINVAWNLRAFGCDPLLITRVGDDREGEEIKATLSSWGMDMVGLQTDPDHATGAVHVNLSEQGDAHFEIVDRCAYDFIEPHKTGALPKGGLLYHGSLALRHHSTQNTLKGIFADTGAAPFVDINLRTPWWSAEALKDWLAQARWLKINDAELEMLSTASGNIEEKARAFLKHYDLEMLVVTQGAQGAFALGGEGGQSEIRFETSIQVVDTVGAGDAFASVAIVGVLRSWPLSLTLNRAQEFASAVVGIRGATTSDKSFYAPFRAAWGG